MRRPLNWIVVSISLLTLFANQMYADSKRRQPPQTPLAAEQTITDSASPFAYVLEDGTQEFLPVAVSTRTAPDLSSGHLHAKEGFDTAFYIWSSPVLTSAAPSSQ